MCVCVCVHVCVRVCINFAVLITHFTSEWHMHKYPTMLVKSAPPTPTMTMERGSLEAATILSTVLVMSEITPSYTGRNIGTP